MSVLIQILNAVPRSVLSFDNGDKIELTQTSKPHAVSTAVRNHKGTELHLSNLNRNGPSVEVHVKGFEGVFYKVQPTNAYSWGFTKDATFAYIYAIPARQPRPEYYPAYFPRVFLVSKQEPKQNLYFLTLANPHETFPALWNLGEDITANEYTQTVQQDQSPYVAAGQGVAGTNNFPDGTSGYAFNSDTL